MLVQIVHLELTGKGHVSGQCYYLDSRGHDEKRHIETYLVIASTSRAVGDGIRTDFLCVFRNRHGLENPLRRYRNRISSIPEDIAINHKSDAVRIVFSGDIQGHIFLGAELIGIFFICFQLFGTESACICTCCIYFISFFLGQIHHIEGCIQTAAECDYNFLGHIRLSIMSVEQINEFHPAMQQLVMARLRFRHRSMLILRIIQHTGAQASGIVVPREDVVVNAA